MNGHRDLRFMAMGMAVVLTCLLFTSCNDDIFDAVGNNSPKRPSDNITFGLSSAESPLTRGGAAATNNKYTAARFVLRADDNSSDTLCVQAVVTDGIEGSTFNEMPLTRGSQVSQSSFYSSFHVAAYWKTGSTLQSNFYMNGDVSDIGSNTWATTDNYYWPGANHSLQFYAWAPTTAFSAVPTTSATTTLSYTVPSSVADQKDLVVAKTAEIAGNSNAVVPLTFKHIGSAVRFVVGNQIQAGTIKTITLKGVNNSGVYDMATETWTLGNTTANFAQTLNLATTSSTTEGSAITAADGFFMMLPQTLSASAELEVVFTDNNSSTDRTLTASLAGAVWEMGKTTTYKISITPLYDLEFTSEPVVQDAHYVIYPITISAADLPGNGNWTLTSNDNANVTFVENFPNADIKDLVDAGYWLKDYKGSTSLTSNSTSATVYVFLKENVSESVRNIELYLRPTSMSEATPVVFPIEQLCPAWNGTLGVERIQDSDYPWGFNWDPTMKITYSMPDLWGGGSWMHLVFWFAWPNYTYLSESGLALTGNWKVTVDFNRIQGLNVATDQSDGKTNTWELYNFKGVNEASTVMDRLENWGGVPNQVLPTNPSEFAAWACAKKNPYSVRVSTQEGHTIYAPELSEADMVWYLPAQDESTLMSDTEYPLSGNYWTSTAINNPGTTAYKYTAGASTSEEPRNNILHVRAVRQKPTN